jgi:hypothetical protein
MNLNQEPISDSFWSIGPYCLGISVTLMVASPMLWCGLLGDDILNANTPDYIQTTYSSLANMIASISEAWSTTKGRLYPVAFALCYTIWNYLYADPLYTKVLSLICFGLSLASCGHFLFRFTRNNCLAFLTLLLMSIEVQLRAWSYDPLLAFPVLVPFVISVIFLQATFLHHYLVTSSRLALATSMLLLSIGLLTYELSFVALPVSFVIVLTTRSERARKLRSAISLFAIPCLYLYVRWKLRAVDAGDYGGVALSFDARKSLHALGVNLFSAIPLNYIIADPRSIFGSAFYVDSTKLFPVLAAISGGFFWIWCRFAVCDQRLARTANNGGAALVGLVLILVPAAMLSVSERYQNEVTLYGYVYLQVCRRIRHGDRWCSRCLQPHWSIWQAEYGAVRIVAGSASVVGLCSECGGGYYSQQGCRSDRPGGNDQRNEGRHFQRCSGGELVGIRYSSCVGQFGFYTYVFRKENGDRGQRSRLEYSAFGRISGRD